MSNQNHLPKGEHIPVKCGCKYCATNSSKVICCKVDYCVNNTILFVIPTAETKQCGFLKNFGYSYYCACPDHLHTFQQAEV